MERQQWQYDNSSGNYEDIQRNRERIEPFENMEPYNERMRPYNDDIKPFNERIGPYNERNGPYNERVRPYNENCDRRIDSYRRDHHSFNDQNDDGIGPMPAYRRMHDIEKPVLMPEIENPEIRHEEQKYSEMRSEVDKQTIPGSFPRNVSVEEKMELDSRSVYVGNVDYGATAAELENLFHKCGGVNRVTIMCNKYDGHPKGFAYVEFSDEYAVVKAITLDDTKFRGRRLKVFPKRTNRPGISTTHRPARSANKATKQMRKRPLNMEGYRPYRSRRFHFSPY